MSDDLRGEVLVSGEEGCGEALVLSQPISFWGGVHPSTGAIIDVRHPECGENIAGRVLFLPGTIGSSSASAVLLELVHAARAPAALVLHAPDAILLLGLIVAKEMGWPVPTAVRLDSTHFPHFANATVCVAKDGTLSSGQRCISPSDAGEDQSMTTISQTAASICFYGDDLDPDEISTLLGTVPTSAHRKGQSRPLKGGREIIRRTGYWSLRAETRSPGDLSAQFREILASATDDLAIWCSVSGRFGGYASCGLYMNEFNEGEELASDVLLALGQRGLHLGLDIYAPLDGEASAD